VLRELAEVLQNHGSVIAGIVAECAIVQHEVFLSSDTRRVRSGRRTAP
jgi:hypothetical protein